MTDTAIVILAAGRSARLGTLKQLLHFKNKTLLQHTIDEAIEADPKTIVVVTGAYAKEVSESIQNEPIEIIFNPHWAQGKGSGIVAGVQKIMASNKAIEKIIIAVCDQPFVTSSLFVRLCQAQKETEKHIVASSYGNTIGTPVLFTRKYFEQLLELKEDEGAKQILMACGEAVATVNFPQGEIDIDTKEDYDKLLIGG